MATIKFFPIGNADCCLVTTEDGRKLLFDYAHCVAGEDCDDLRTDLKAEIEKDMKAAERDSFEVVAFSHADDDHVRGAKDLFWLEHAKMYQGDGRYVIKELWVPAGFLLEEGLTDDARIIRQEARYRLKQGSGIKIFSTPNLLKGWLADEGIDPGSIQHLLVDAGNIVPGFSLTNDAVEFFVHSPFAHRDGDELQARNEGSLFLQVTFEVRGRKTRMMLGADTTYDVLEDLIAITKFHGRLERLEWDIYKLSHHCSYTALASEKGDKKTEPSDVIDAFFKDGSPGALIVSPSMPIPAEDTIQPPHKQAAAFYREVADHLKGQFIVTMEYPKIKEPKPLVIRIDGSGFTVIKAIAGATTIMASGPAPRVG